MKLRRPLLAVLALATSVAVVLPLASTASPPSAASRDRLSVAETLNTYEIEATPDNLKALAAGGYDVTEGRRLDEGTVEVVGYEADLAKFDAKRLSSYRSEEPVARRAPTDGADDSAYTVWTKYDAVAGDDKEQYTETYDRVLADYPAIAERRDLGATYGGRQITAIQITRGATGADIPRRPAVLYNSMQHAREWLAGETCRRTLDYVTSNYGTTTSAGREVTRLVNTTELWFVCVNNPDGYEYTFTPGNRLWRKNLRDNNTDGSITIGDGVDPNRNFPKNWGRDEEGSASDPADDTYRGPSAASEPETKAMQRLFNEIHPVFHKNDHTAAELLLYPQGFQQDTPTADHEIFTALAGDVFKPAIPGFVPELSAGLYITNGDFSDWAYGRRALSFTPEGTAPEEGSVFVYPDSPLQVRQEFQRHLPFVLDLANSALHPDRPSSHLDNTARDFVVDSFTESYGNPQPVGATVKRSLGAVKMHFRINNRRQVIVPTRNYRGGQRYNIDPGVYYRRVRGTVYGTKPGDRVTVWFTGGGKGSRGFTYRVRSDSGRSVLLLADENWSGVQPNPTPASGPSYLGKYGTALRDNRVKYDVYDIDAHNRVAPDPLGILSHYSHVVWYTGDDYVPREPDAPGGSGITKRAVETQNNVRDFINDGGKVFYSGQNAGRVFAEGYSYNPFQDEEDTYCQGGNPVCIIVQDDFLQYWLGAYTYVAGGGQDPDSGDVFPVQGTAGEFDGLDLTVNGPGSADNAGNAPSLLVTSSVLDPVQFPEFADSAKVAGYDRPFASPYEPIDGDWFVSAGSDNQAYKRFARQVAIPAGGGKLNMSTSFDLESDYDYLFVEIHTVGQDDWTTLEDTNGHTSDDVGLSCPSTGDGSDWQSLHPFLAHYQTKIDGGDDCTPTGSSGEWNAATGNSSGWQDWSMPIPAAYNGENVEISITVASDPATLGLGTWIDKVQVVDSADAPIGSTDPSFESGLDGWAPAPPPANTASQLTGWERAMSTDFVEGSIISTDDTVYSGIGVESVAGRSARADYMQSALAELGLD